MEKFTVDKNLLLIFSFCLQSHAMTFYNKALVIHSASFYVPQGYQQQFSLHLDAGIELGKKNIYNLYFLIPIQLQFYRHC